MWDVEAFRTQFPVFAHNPSWAYLDNAATTHKPQAVVEAIADFYGRDYATVHRGAYQASASATRAFEGVRTQVKQLLNARAEDEVIFTSGATAGINLVANSFLADRLQPGDSVVVTAMEHHSNLLPWQALAAKKEATLRVIRVDNTGELNLRSLTECLDSKTRILAVTQVSNVLGTVNPLKEIAAAAKKYGIPVLVDAAQGALLHPIDVQDWDVDFLVFSGHKAFGPTGIGVLYGKKERLETMGPWQFGGEMILDASFVRSEYAPPPRRFEAGTPHIAGVIGLGAALRFIGQMDREAALAYTVGLREYAVERLQDIPGIKILAKAAKGSVIISFSLENIHPHDAATFLNQDQVAVRSGFHCAQPLIEYFGFPGTVRVSLAPYNTLAELERMRTALERAVRVLGG